MFIIACSGNVSQNQNIDKILEDNPEIVIEALRKNKGELLKIIEEAIKAKEMAAFLDNPMVPVLEKGRPVRGNIDAEVTIVDYSDFECPFCSKVAKTLDAVMDKYGDKVRIFYKHNPLSFHKNAMPAAIYFEAIAKQSTEKGWKFHDIIFENQGMLNGGKTALKEAASNLGIDMARLEVDIESAEIRERISRDMEEAKRFGFTGTPSFLINGIPLKGAYPKEKFFEIIDTILSM